MDRPDLQALVNEWKTKLRILDWRINVTYTPDLTNAAGQPVYGLCSRLVDNKTATIQIRDPNTPAPTSAPAPSVEEIVIHELSHLLVAPLAGSSPADIANEEQIVWAFSEALVNAKGTPQQAMILRAMKARTEGRSAAAPNTKGPTMDPKIVSAAIAAIKSGDGDGALAMLEKMLVAAAGGTAAPEPDGDEAAPTDAAKAPPPPPPASDDKKPMPPPPASAAMPAEARAMAVTDPLVAQLAAEVQTLTAERSARIAADLNAERSALASREGLSPTLAAIVRDAKTPIETARQIASVAKGTDAQPTRGANTGSERSARLPAGERLELDQQMGIRERATPIRFENGGRTQIVGAMTAEQARAYRAMKESK